MKRRRQFRIKYKWSSPYSRWYCVLQRRWFFLGFIPVWQIVGGGEDTTEPEKSWEQFNIVYTKTEKL